jgi:hypothetical protein
MTEIWVKNNNNPLLTSWRIIQDREKVGLIFVKNRAPQLLDKIF